MKKRFTAWILWLLTLTLLTGTTLAEGSYTGTVAPGEVVQLSAPFTAVVERVEAETGDLVHSGDLLFQLTTTRVYAPCDGTVQGVLVQEGDRLEDASQFYAGALYIEPQVPYLLRASTDAATGEKENKLLHVGETVYLRRSSDSNRRTGTGRIIAVTDGSFTVEVLSGDLQLDDNCYLYRSASYDSDTRIGRGMVVRNAPVAVNGTGTLLKLHVQDGQSVRKGDLLMETAAGAAPGADAQISAPVDGILAASNVTVGGTISQNQSAMTLWPLGTFVLQLNVDEYDLPKFEIGQRYTAALDCMPSKTYEATVSEISYYPVQEAGKTSYEVTLCFPNDDFVRPGMSVTLTEGR